MYYFIQEHLHRRPLDGGITNVDIEKVFIALGYQPIQAPGHFDFSIPAKIQRLLFALTKFIRIPAGARIIFQFPVYARVHNMLIKLLLLRNSVTIVCLIADIDGIRDGDAVLLKSELRQLRRFRYFIVHNKKMEGWLQAVHKQSKCIELQFFPFLTQPVVRTRTREHKPVIAFAGNLSKAPFVDQLHRLRESELIFHVYGNPANETRVNSDNVLYKGVFEPYQLPRLLTADFGLVWDGDSLTKCGGTYGRYMMINTAHKLSLYIVSAIPIIVWEKAAVAPLIKQYNIGFSIASLFEIEKKIKNLPDADYKAMSENMKPLAEKICSGKILTEVLQELEARIAAETRQRT